MVELSGRAGEIEGMGYRIVALSPDRPEKIAEMRERISVSVPIYSDSDVEAASAFGVAFRVDEEGLERLKGFGIDLEDASGKDHHILPVPSVFIVDGEGRVRFEYVQPDYRYRIDPDLLVAAAQISLRKPEIKRL
ncbi:MAG: hypothetical protein D6713_08925 [Deltaproteobacteria bacterium]|nr:MAG: hypothetical protein D6713_08925 [Deltaproteobacteria bacterium]